MDIIDIAMELVDLGTSSDLEVFFGVAWAIWHNRNKIVHEAFSHHPDQIWFFANSHRWGGHSYTFSKQKYVP